MIEHGLEAYRRSIKTGGQEGCRCPLCRAANAAYGRERYKPRRYSTPELANKRRAETCRKKREFHRVVLIIKLLEQRRFFATS
jgi:hypothetical protein